MRRALVALIVAMAGCVKSHPPPAIPVIKADLESNYVQMKECVVTSVVQGGAAASKFTADGAGANLIIAFVFATKSSTYNNVTTSYTTLTGIAVRCPPEVVGRLTAAAAQKETVK